MTTYIYQLLNCDIGFSMVLPLFSANSLLSRLTSIFLGFAPTFLLLSIGYIFFFPSVNYWIRGFNIFLTLESIINSL